MTLFCMRSNINQLTQWNRMFFFSLCELQSTEVCDMLIQNCPIELVCLSVSSKSANFL